MISNIFKTICIQLILVGAYSAIQAQTFTDVIYTSKSPSNKLDVYIPTTGKALYPTIIIIHGGGFSGGDKGPESRFAKAMVSRGFAVACINYRSSNEAKFPAQIYDVKAAIRFLKAKAADYSMDTTRFATWGESAGGGLAALAGTSGDVSAVEDRSMGNSNYTSKVKASVVLSGCIDFLTMNNQWKELGETNGYDYNASTSYASVFMGGAIQTKKELCKDFNAETYITPDDGYFWLEHGTADNTIPYLQAKVFADSLIKVIPSGRVSLHIIDGARHVDDKFFTNNNLDSIASFLKTAFSTDIK
ncbi:MAG: alpha/beta hydrolase [Salinivirgaceae bacterium]|jgi:acetyl esterase/lipase